MRWTPNTEQQQQHSIFLGTRRRSTPVTSQQENRWMYAATENVKMAAVYLNFLTYLVLEISLTKMSWVIKLRIWTIHNEVFNLKFICLLRGVPF